MRSFAFLTLLIFDIILYILSLRAQKKNWFGVQRLISHPEEGRNPFECVARLLYCLLNCQLSSSKKGILLQSIMRAPQVQNELRTLHPGQKVEQASNEYFIQKIKLIVVIIFVGTLFSLFIYLQSEGSGILNDGKYFIRNKYGDGNKQARVWVETEDGEYKRHVEIDIDEVVYTEEELEWLWGQAIPILEQDILNGNESVDLIKTDLNLPDHINGFPFHLSWESSNYDLVDHKGRIHNEQIGAAGECITLGCMFSYRNWQKFYSISVMLYPPEKDDLSVWADAVEDALLQADEETRYSKEYVLPIQIGGKSVLWTEQKEDYSVLVLLGTVLVAFCLFFLQDKDLRKKVGERNRQMQEEYPVLINRLVLYLGAGMSIKGAFHKIAMDYRDRREGGKGKQYVYEEMLYTCYEMQSGAAEGSAYEEFGKRCGLQSYIRLAGLLSVSLKKGNAALLVDLRKEAVEAQQERKNLARKKGEEAGTKLLFPMMLMLGIVMILIMVPAMMSFAV